MQRVPYTVHSVAQKREAEEELWRSQAQARKEEKLLTLGWLLEKEKINIGTPGFLSEEMLDEDIEAVKRTTRVTDLKTKKSKRGDIPLGLQLSNV